MQTSKFSTMAMMMNRNTQLKALSQFPSKLFSWSTNSSPTTRRCSKSYATTTSAPRIAPMSPKLSRFFFPSSFLQLYLCPGKLNMHVSQKNPILLLQDLCFPPTTIEPQFKTGYKSMGLSEVSIDVLNQLPTRMPVVQRLSKIDEEMGNAGRFFWMNYCKKDPTLLPYELACKSVVDLDDEFGKINADIKEMILRDAKGGDKSFTCLKTLGYKTAGVDAANVGKICSGEGDNPAPPPPPPSPEIMSDSESDDDDDDDDDDDELIAGISRLATIPEVDNENESDDNSAPENEPASAPANENEKRKYTIYYSDTEDDANKKTKKQKGGDDSDTFSDSDDWGDFF